MILSNNQSGHADSKSDSNDNDVEVGDSIDEAIRDSFHSSVFLIRLQLHTAHFSSYGNPEYLHDEPPFRKS